MSTSPRQMHIHPKTLPVEDNADNNHGWVTVRRMKSRSKRSISTTHAGNTSGVSPISLISLYHLSRDESAARIDRILHKLHACPWWASVRALLTNPPDHFHPTRAGVRTRDDASATAPLYSHLVCLGLGSFVASSNARHQLALAVAILRDTHLIPPGLSHSHCPPTIADPAMLPDDEALAALYGFTVTRSLDHALSVQGTLNTTTTTTITARESKQPFTPPASRSLIFMPHCIRTLYDDVLEHFSSPPVALHNIVIFGNAFRGLYDAAAGPPEAWTYIDRVVASGVASEVPCPNADVSLSYEAFNDLAVIHFQPPSGSSPTHASEKSSLVDE